MRGVILLVYLCCLLLRGMALVNAGNNGIHHNALCCLPTEFIQEDQKSKLTAASQDHPSIRKSAPTNNNAYQVVDREEEDESNTNTLARKYKLLSRYPFTLFRQGIHQPSHGNYKDRRLLNTYLSEKYITQRTLRI